MTPQDAEDALAALEMDGWADTVQAAMNSPNWQLKSDAVTAIGEKIAVRTSWIVESDRKMTALLLFNSSFEIVFGSWLQCLLIWFWSSPSPVLHISFFSSSPLHLSYLFLFFPSFPSDSPLPLRNLNLAVSTPLLWLFTFPLKPVGSRSATLIFWRRSSRQPARQRPTQGQASSANQLPGSWSSISVRDARL